MAQAIRDQIANRNPSETYDIVGQDLDDLSDFTEAAEGRLLTVSHLKRERNRKLVQKKKAAVLAATKKLCCEACGLDLADQYGERGQRVIECHHNKPLETLTCVTVTKLSDLALVCANCHRIIHAKRPWMSVLEVQALLQESGAITE